MIIVTERCKCAAWIHSDLSERDNRIRSCLALKFESSESNLSLLLILSTQKKKSSHAKLIFREKFWRIDHNFIVTWGSINYWQISRNQCVISIVISSFSYSECFRDGNSMPESKRSKTWSHSRFTFFSLLANVQYIKCLFLGSSNKMTFSGLIFFSHFWFVQGKLQKTGIWFPKGIHKNLTFWNCYFLGCVHCILSMS